MPKSLEDWDHRWQGASIPMAAWHFHRRLFQRYNGFVLPPGAYSKMIRHIRIGHRRTYLLRQREDKTAVWAVWVKDLAAGRLIYVVYDPQSQTAVTALPPSLQLLKLYRRARALQSAPRLAAEAAGELAVAALNQQTLAPIEAGFEGA